VLERRQRIELPAQQAFEFFGAARNLEAITPPWLGFRVITPGTIEMRPGTLIDYRLKLHGIPVRWRTEIAEWRPPYQFVDQQLKGPYWSWHHTHTFTAADGGTLVEDTVRYRPLGGRIVHQLFVRRDLERIFVFRQQEILAAFGVPSREPITVSITPLI
jgi:ligand-binding SRPBCC domain-containing protein